MDLTSFLIFWILSMALLAGLGMLLQAGTQAEIAKRQALSRWPKTSGVVTGARLEERRSAIFVPGRILPSFVPVIEYTYQIGGKTFQSASYKNAWSPFNRSGKWRTIYPRRPPASSKNTPPEKPSK